MSNFKSKIILATVLSFFSITAVAQFEDCTNGIDDDGDGDIDCFDANCASSPFCQSFESNCTDGIDNDGDGLPDCLDSDCRFSGDCPVESDCNNGIDDDGDGFFDYYDGDCLNDPSNPNTYITSVADCEVRPQGNVFDIEVEWQSDARTSGVYSVPTVADLDQDGIPEIISTNERGRSMTILRGSDGSTINSISFSQQVFVYPAVADVDGDGFGEIFVFDRRGRLRAYNHNLTPFWSGSRQAPINDSRMVNIADFNQDGNPEVYFVNEIRDAQSGDLIIKGSHNQGSKNRQWQDHVNGVSVAVDILPDSYCTDCQGLELVLGHLIYSVDIDNQQLTEVLNLDDAATKTLVNSFGGFNYDATDNYRPKKAQFGTQNFSSTSVVDFNEDGYLDVVLSGTLNSSRNGPSMVFFWDITNNSVLARIITRPYSQIPGSIRGTYRDVNGGGCNPSDGECTWRRGMGTLNIANIDADPELEITFMSGSSLYALDNQLNEEWANHNDFWETSSGFTGTTVFDFDGDGSSEVVYRDEIDLYIIDGTTGLPLNNQVSGVFCSSQTQAEYPVVADVDGDGETEIVVSCGCRKNTRSSLGTNNTRDCGFVRAYKAANNNYWVPSRRLWNQFAYFNVNVNDDLTIPRFQQYHHLGFAQECNLLAGSTGFSLNKFLNQSPVINYCGNLTFPAANLEFADNPVQVNPSVCPDDRFQVRLRFINTGDEVAFRDIPISFYAQDPTQAYADIDPNPYLETQYINIPGGFQVGQLVDTTLWVNGRAGAFTLHVSLNDIGPYDINGSSLSNSTFYPLDSLNGVIRECDGTPTLVAADVNPLPFNTTGLLVSDNDFCPGSINSNGEITAHVAGDTVGFVFRWYSGSNTSGAPVFIGATQKGLSGGTYTVEAFHPVANCTGSSATVEVRDLAAPPVVNAEVVAEQTSCNASAPNGALNAYVLEGGTPVTAGYNFFWYRGENTITPARPGYTGGAEVDGLPAGTYRLVVENATTGCTATLDLDIPENIVYPVLSLDAQQDQTNCDPTSYDGGASVSVGGNTTDYDFYWFSGNVFSPDTTAGVIANSPAITGLAAGNYTAFAANKVTRCLSDPIRVTIDDQTWDPVVNAQLINPQEACDPALANGALEASVDESSRGGGSNVTAGYTFNWYLGTFTAANLPGSPTASGSSVTNLQEGSYTLVTRNNITGCQTLTNINLPAQRNRPVLDADYSVTHANNCTDPWGSEITVTTNGGETAADGYTFQWRNLDTGTTLAETSHVLSNVPPGQYGVTVTNTLACTSVNELEITIRDEAPKPQVNLQTVANASCDPTQPNGMLIATGFTGSATDYSFEWFYNSVGGTPVEAAKIISSGDTVRTLPGGNYALRIVNNTTQCASLAFASVSNRGGIVPSLDTLYTQATTDCRPAFANGEVAFYLPAGVAQLPPDNTQDRTYTFELYSGATVSGSPLLTSTDGQFTGLNEGEYTAIVRDEYNHCVSAPVTVDIDKAPGISITVDTFVPSSACASADGSIGITVGSPNNSSPGGPGYDFQWYYSASGDPLSGTVDPGTALATGDDFSSARTDLPSGFYLVEVSDRFSNCVESFEFFLPNADPPQITNSGTPAASQCLPGNGSLFIEVTSPSIMLDLFRVYLYEGSTVDAGNHIDNWTPLALPSDSHTFTDLPAGEYTVAFQEFFGGGCFSTVETFTVPDATPVTDITISGDVDFSCNATGTGRIVVSDIQQDGSLANLSDFSYTWYEGLGTTGTVVGNTREILNVSSGNYTVEVVDNSGDGLGCVFTESYFLDNQPRNLAINNITTLPDRVCTGENGEISVGQITENGTAVSLTNYTLRLYDDALTLINPATYTGNGMPATPFAGLPSGTYYVEAVNNATDCNVLSAAVIVDIDTYQPQISLVHTFPDFSCTGGIPTGELSIAALSPADGDTVQFQYAWYDAAGNPVGSDSTLVGMPAGEYRVEVTDANGLSLGCLRSAVFEIPAVERQIQFTLAGLDPTFCDPANGEIYVESITESYFFQGTTQTSNTTVSDYDISLLNDTLGLMANGGSGTMADPFVGLDEAVYYVQVQNSLTDNCISEPVNLALESLCEPPVLSIELNSPQYSQNPDPSTWTGSLTAGVTESDNNPVDSASNNFTYAYEWYTEEDYNIATGGPMSPGGPGSPIGTNPTISGLDSGTYVLVVRNEVTGAVSVATFNVENVYVEPVFMANSFPQTVCFPDGSILLDNISFNEADDDPGKYTILLYQDQNLTNIVDSVVVSNTGDTLFTNLSEGPYYLQARHDDFLVYSNFNEVWVDNVSTAPQIDLDLDNLAPQISCQPDVMATGRLAVVVNERDGSVADYRYQWYTGNSPRSENIIAGANQAILDSLPSGFFTVEVFNETTQCTSVATFFVEDQIEIPLVQASAEPSTVCDPALADGRVSASVVQNGSYTYAWYEGSSTAGQPAYTGPSWTGLMPGTYTVVATDVITRTCLSDPVSVVVEDVSSLPVISVESLADNTACDPSLSNGVLSAVVQDEVSNYEFNWYDSQGNLITEEASIIGSLSEGRYRLTALYKPTGCEQEAWGEIILAPQQYNQPTVSVEAHMTNCMNPDGSANVIMFEDNEGFVFNWFDADGNPLPDEQVEINENDLSSRAVNLRAGNYYVEAFDLTTGCYTPRAMTVIEDESYVPGHQLEIEAAACELSDGTLKVIPQGNMTISSIEWTHLLTGEVYESNYQLEDAPAGDYEYVILWVNGCSSYGTANLPTDINAFNGLSPNGDGENDYFHIDCIEQFPQNKVKIFNRAGALIYEDENYDNTNVYFDGVGNRGLYVGGNELPDGTYFYVIEKNDGSQPKTGYLELSR